MENKLATTGGGGEKDTFIVCRNSQGIEVRAIPLRMTRHLVVFEVYNPYSIIQLSEVLSEFQIIMNERLIYSGRAVVSNLLNTGILLVCEATLDDAWLDVDIFSPVNRRERLRTEFDAFLTEFQKVYRVRPEFKVVVSDMQSFLMDLRRWMEQVELGVRSQPSANRLEIERGIIEDLKTPILPTFETLFTRFEEVCNQVAEEGRPFHGTYVKRQLHPVVLCAPFFYRSFRKPLGYAGDYEMVNMMLRDPLEGSSMFAKLLNTFFLSTPPVVAHRNRIDFLVRHLREEIGRVAARGQIARIFNLGCGPAREIQALLAQDSVCDHAHFTLLDFNEETLMHTGKILEELRQRHRRKTQFQLVQKSVHQILKEAVRPTNELEPRRYDFVYCAGLFDYLSDRICKRLMNVFFETLAPEGLLLTTNVESSNPSRNWMEYVVEWHLVYRNREQLESLTPDDVSPGTVVVETDRTGVNIFFRVRKSANA